MTVTYSTQDEDKTKTKIQHNMCWTALWQQTQ